MTTQNNNKYKKLQLQNLQLYIFTTRHKQLQIHLQIKLKKAIKINSISPRRVKIKNQHAGRNQDKIKKPPSCQNYKSRQRAQSK